MSDLFSSGALALCIHVLQCPWNGVGIQVFLFVSGPGSLQACNGGKNGGDKNDPVMFLLREEGRTLILPCVSFFLHPSPLPISITDV